MAEISVIRHLSVFDPSKFNDTPIHIVGVGATGSRVFMALVELGLTNIHCHDFDSVEGHNLANQIYGYDDIGKLKVQGCYDAYMRKTGNQPPKSMTFSDLAVPNDKVSLEGVVFLLTDTMSSRREIFDTCLKGNFLIECVIETRMASSYGNVFVFEPCIGEQADKWLSTLISDDEGEVSVCGTSISVGTTASIIANLAVWQMIHYLTDKGALDGFTNIFLKPLTVASGNLKKYA